MIKGLQALAVCALCMPGAVLAQAVPATAIGAEALTHVRDGKIHGCGVRLTGGEPGRAVSGWFDVSFNVFRRGIGIAQSMAYEIRPSEEGESRPQQVPVQSTWLKASEGSTRRGENTERRNSLVYTLLIEDVLSLFEAIAKEEPLVLGITRWDQRTDSVYTAIPVLNMDSRDRIGTCLAGLALE